jgi:hypothetical protein
MWITTELQRSVGKRDMHHKGGTHAGAGLGTNGRFNGELNVVTFTDAVHPYSGGNPNPPTVRSRLSLPLNFSLADALNTPVGVGGAPARAIRPARASGSVGSMGSTCAIAAFPAVGACHSIGTGLVT